MSRFNIGLTLAAFACVLFGVRAAETEVSAVGYLMDAVGDQSDGTAKLIRGGEAIEASEGLEVLPGDRIVTDGQSKIQVVFLDSSSVGLFENSELRIVSYNYPAKRTPTRVYLNGDAYFSIHERPADAHFFIDTGYTGDVEVKGTKFEIITYLPANGSTSYTSNVYVSNGTVTINGTSTQGATSLGNYLTVTPSQAATWIANLHISSPLGNGASGVPIVGAPVVKGVPKWYSTNNDQTIGEVDSLANGGANNLTAAQAKLLAAKAAVWGIVTNVSTSPNGAATITTTEKDPDGYTITGKTVELGPSRLSESWKTVSNKKVIQSWVENSKTITVKRTFTLPKPDSHTFTITFTLKKGAYTGQTDTFGGNQYAIKAEGTGTIVDALNPKQPYKGVVTLDANGDLLFEGAIGGYTKSPSPTTSEILYTLTPPKQASGLPGVNVGQTETVIEGTYNTPGTKNYHSLQYGAGTNGVDLLTTAATAGSYTLGAFTGEPTDATGSGAAQQTPASSKITYPGDNIAQPSQISRP